MNDRVARAVIDADTNLKAKPIGDLPDEWIEDIREEAIEAWALIGADDKTNNVRQFREHMIRIAAIALGAAAILEHE